MDYKTDHIKTIYKVHLYPLFPGICIYLTNVEFEYCLYRVCASKTNFIWTKLILFRISYLYLHLDMLCTLYTYIHIYVSYNIKHIC